MKRNRWKNRLSLLLVALMLFTTLAPVALAVGEPEAVTEVTEPAESDKVSEDPSEAPAPAPAEETPNIEPGAEEETPTVEPNQVEKEAPEISGEPEPEAVLQGANPGTKIIFVKENSTEVPVTFTEDTQKLGLNGVSPKGFLNYFIGWSENQNYKANGEGHLFYESATLADVKKAGLTNSQNPIKLYELRVGIPDQNLLQSMTGVRINDDVEATDFVELGNPVRDENNKNLTIATYQETDGDYKIKKLDAVFTMNPFVAAAVYKDPWVGALENGSKWTELNQRKGNITAVDLHVELDPRIVLPDEFELTFKSYVFRPIQFYSELHADGTSVAADENYPILSIDNDGGEKNHGILENIKDNEPSTTFRVRSYITDPQGKKVPVHKFVLRTRIRIGYDKNGNKIPATMEQIQSDMHLTFSSSKTPFKVSNDDAKLIANDEQKPILVKGSINGRVRGKISKFNPIVDFGPIESEDELLDFVKGETPTPPVNPPVEPPVVHHKTVSVEKIWEDGNDEAKKRPDSITVKLLANGEDTGKRLVLSAKDNWKGSFYGLDYTKDGKTIEYTVAEIGVKDYESKVSGSDKSGYIITNTVVPEKPAPAPTPEIKLPKIPHITKPLVVPTIPKAGVGR